MPQTMLALLGLMLVAQFSLSQRRDVMNDRLATLETEVRTITAAVATEHLGRVASMPFDDATKGGNDLTSASELTPSWSFRSDAPSDDVDDFDGSLLVVGRPAGSDSLWFDIQTTVSYADEMRPDTPITGQTKLKLVTAVVSVRRVAFADTVKLSRLVSCGSACQW